MECVLLQVAQKRSIAVYAILKQKEHNMREREMDMHSDGKDGYRNCIP